MVTISTFQLKGGLYPLTALQLLETDLKQFSQQLIDKIQQAPKFFHQAPIVIDLQKLDPSQALDFKSLKSILLEHHLIPVGVKGGHREHLDAATAAGFAILQTPTNAQNIPSMDLPPQHKNAEPTQPESPLKSDSRRESKVITEPVRSGQQIYARESDLIILGAVSHGAEILADGHIHVYGPLRGRALAGVTGNTSAHIFCQSLEAELISIAGEYQISEEFEKTAWRVPADISLETEHLQIRTF